MLLKIGLYVWSNLIEQVVLVNINPVCLAPRKHFGPILRCSVGIFSESDFLVDMINNFYECLYKVLAPAMYAHVSC